MTFETSAYYGQPGVAPWQFALQNPFAFLSGLHGGQGFGGGLGYPQLQGFGQQGQFGPPFFGQQGQFGTPFLAQQGQFGTPFFAQHGQQGFGGGGGLGYPQLGGITPHGLFGHL